VQLRRNWTLFSASARPLNTHARATRAYACHRSPLSGPLGAGVTIPVHPLPPPPPPPRPRLPPLAFVLRATENTMERGSRPTSNPPPACRPSSPPPPVPLPPSTPPRSDIKPLLYDAALYSDFKQLPRATQDSLFFPFLSFLLFFFFLLPFSFSFFFFSFFLFNGTLSPRT